ncbi:succinylglutamate desuccinylase/aspartoacylase family protein [Methanobrevibacter sp.]|uniref:succinylglutamate desuccinylase/aspartoacylase domain-containing protein n=1 Tax=Methanobrevibacter sp. TaxID=66852 RepID=UPI0025FAE98B|nr:succinylglutamate desuccinylase/aspartoacylase family protein [Methanobrevibacter sp.]MBQ6512663.1 succinylglutamate desuccinylase/aspartoacylase family protein [Methanobrevibacter sp.]
MYFEKVEDFDNLEVGYISNLSGGYISKNTHLFDNIELNKLNRFILEKSVYGTPIFKLGKGGNKLLILSGVHGNELPPQIANIKLLNELVAKKINNTLFFIPFAAPKATMDNRRFFHTLDLNRAAHVNNSLSNVIVQKIEELGINFVGDFHSTAFNSNPGVESIFSTKSPTPESFLIASYISRDVGCEIISLDSAGESYKGAVEDVCNLKGIPAITGEVLSPFSTVGDGSVERSLLQMKSFLSYFGT